MCFYEQCAPQPDWVGFGDLFYEIFYIVFLLFSFIPKELSIWLPTIIYVVRFLFKRQVTKKYQLLFKYTY